MSSSWESRRAGPSLSVGFSRQSTAAHSHNLPQILSLNTIQIWPSEENSNSLYLMIFTNRNFVDIIHIIRQEVLTGIAFSLVFQIEPKILDIKLISLVTFTFDKTKKILVITVKSTVYLAKQKYKQQFMDPKNWLKKCHQPGRTIRLLMLLNDFSGRSDQLIVAKSSGIWFQPNVRKILLRKNLNEIQKY